MKIAYSLFAAALLWLFIFPLGAAFSHYADYQKNGADAELVVADLKKYRDVVTPDSEVTERTLKIGFVEVLLVEPGFHLIHDPSLGQEVVVKGPTNVLDVIEKHQFPNHRFHFMFNQAVQIEDPVEVRMNLNAHHVGTFRFTFLAAKKKTNWTNFTTLGPIVGHHIEIGGQVRSDTELLIDANKLTYSGGKCNSCTSKEVIKLVGRANELALPNLSQTTMDFTKLDVKTFRRSFQAMDGRNLKFGAIEKLSIIYATDPNDIIDNETLVFRADTFRVGRGTDVEVQYRDGDLVKATNEAVIVRE